MNEYFRILFFWPYWSGHPLSQLIIYKKKRQNLHNKASVAATIQIEKSKPEWLLCLVSQRLWICYTWAGQWQPCTPSVRHFFHVNLSMYIYAVAPSCLCSSMLCYSFLHLPSCPLVRWSILTKAYLHQRNTNPMHKCSLGVGTAPSKVSPWMAVGHNIYHRHPEPAALIRTWGLSQQCCQGS